MASFRGLGEQQITIETSGAADGLPPWGRLLGKSSVLRALNH